MRDGVIDGAGEFTDSEGNRYVGGFASGVYEGAATYYLADGRAEVSRYSKGREVGQGAAWSADRKTAWLITQGQQPKPIGLSRAIDIASELGLPAPAVPQVAEVLDRNMI